MKSFDWTPTDIHSCSASRDFRSGYCCYKQTMVLSQTLNGLKEPTMSSTSDKERKGPFCKNDEGIVEDVQIKATESEEGTGTGGVGV